jgi:spore maturation protein CgeB
VDAFFEPDKEILVAEDGDGVAEWMRFLSPVTARKIGEAAYRRVLAKHTYAHRAAQIESVLGVRSAVLAGVAV